MSGSNPQWTPGYIPSAGEWNLSFAGKLDYGSGIGFSVGQIPAFANRGGRPSFELNNQWIINQTAPGPTIGTDVLIRHDGTGVTTGSAGTINKLLQLTQGVDTNDPNTNWSFLVNTATTNTLGAKVLPAYFQMWQTSGNAHIWGQVTEVHDFTGQPSSVSGPSVTQELDLVTSGADDATNTAKFGGRGSRSLIHAVIGRDQGAALNEVTHGLWIGTGSAYVDSIIGFEISGGSAPSMFIQALDTRGAIVPTGYTDPLAAVRMSAGQIIDFNGGPALNSAAGNYLKYDSATGKLFYYVGGVAKWSVDASGNMRCAGTVTGSVTP